MGLGTGHGTTISVNGGTAIAFCRQLTGAEFTTPPADISHLETVGTRDYVPGDLAEISPMTAEALFDTEQTELVENSIGEVIVTYPQRSGETAPANHTGQGWITRRKDPDAVTNEAMFQEFDIQWASRPTFTAATTT